MAEKKITKRENYVTIVEILKGIERTDLAEVILHEIELLDKKADKAKNSTSKATIEKRAENSKLADIVYNILTENGDYMTIAEIKTKSDELADFSSSKLGYLLGTLIAENKVDRIIKKKVAMYKIV